MKYIVSLFTLSAIILFSSCERELKEKPVKGYIPLYENEIDKTVKLNQAPRTLSNPGKIYVYGNMLFVNERGNGIHVIDNTNPESPVKLAYHEILGCDNMAVKNGIMYVGYGYGMLSIDMNAPAAAELLNFIQYPGPEATQPDRVTSIKDNNGLINYICPDSNKGAIIGWYYGQFGGTYCSVR